MRDKLLKTAISTRLRIQDAVAVRPGEDPEAGMTTLEIAVWGSALFIAATAGALVVTGVITGDFANI